MNNKLERLNMTPSKDVITEQIINGQNNNCIMTHLQAVITLRNTQG
ncbi:hypothetical protein NSU08_19260 [Paenibacillus sp. FSL H7-0331]